MKKLLIFLLFSFLSFSSSFPQWSVGGSYIIKNQFPFIGFGINVSRNLPFQWADVGFEVRTEFDWFKARDVFEENNFSSILTYKMIDGNLSLIGIFFPRYIYPYFGILFGLSSLYFEKFEPAGNRINISNKEKLFFSLVIIGGIEFPLFYPLFPIIEVRLIKYFNSFDEFEFNREISKLQVQASFGIIFKFDFIK